MKKIRIDFGCVTKVDNTSFKDVSKIIVNGGGGMGGSREEILGEIITRSNDLGFMEVKDIMSNEIIEIHPRYIGTIRKTNMTKLYFEHKNSNFPSGKRTEWYTHRVGTEIGFYTNNDYPPYSVVQKDESLNIKHIHTDDMKRI